MKKEILPPTYFLIYLVAAIALHFLSPVAKIIHAPYSYLGIVLVVLGTGINIWADNLFKRRKTTVKPREEPAALVTGGPFRFSRHPMYLGFVAILLGEAVLLGSLVAFLAPLAMFLTCEIIFISHEERNLEEKFGGKYRDYKERVRRWL